MKPVESFVLNDGAIIPSRGLGTHQVDPKAYPHSSLKTSVLAALKAGCRHIDTSLRYDNGNNEREVGEAIRESRIPREEIYVVTKLENVFHAPEDVEVGMDLSLRNLGVDYVPYAYKKTVDFGTQRDAQGRPLVDVELSRAFDVTWKVMEALVDNGKARSISNFSSPKVRRLLQTARIKPAVHQIECHPHWPQKGLVQLCQSSGIHVTAFGPLGCAPIPSMIGRTTGPGPLKDETIATLAKKYTRTPAQLILCFSLCRGVSVIPKSNSPARIAENWDCIFELAEEDFAVLDVLVGAHGERGVRNLESATYLGFDNYNEEREEP
ncbi:hypothetical protein Daus18300_014507 [Diaporthe australafricana]|uniref:NADP-dependent oxidoreductase domain-containing protein n=1 Tax=Diaporthe australafricana TaxID=127596 RepID=A0ABR3VUX9_9PEZI